jgi:dihydroflavonol-4-reductase
MRALVTGASGFLGRHVVDALLSGGATVRALDRRVPADGTLAEVQFVQGDVLDPDAVTRAVRGCEAVFHLAAVYSYRRRDGALMRTVNIDGTRVVLDAALRGESRRVVHTSSCVTCGPVPGRPATEADRPPPRDAAIPYRRSKIEAERLALRAARDGAAVVVVNPTAPVGPGDSRPTPTGKMVADVAGGRIRGYLTHSALNIVSVEDVAAGHILALERGASGRRYLLGGEDMGVRAVFSAIAAAAGIDPPPLPVPWPVAYAAALAGDWLLRPFGRDADLLGLDSVRAGRLPHLFDDTRARAELGYVSRPAADALAAAVRDVLGATC